MEPAMTPASEVKVWDPLIRVFHWATVTLCLLNFFVLEEGSNPQICWLRSGHPAHHPPVGAGRPYARFGQWWPTPARVRYYLRQLAQGATPTTSATIRSAP
jgi:cytochrome b